MSLRREQVEQWYTAGVSGNRGIVAWVADTANASDPTYPILAKIALAVQQGTEWLQWIALHIELSELQARGQDVAGDIATVRAKIAALPDPTQP